MTKEDSTYKNGHREKQENKLAHKGDRSWRRPQLERLRVSLDTSFQTGSASDLDGFTTGPT